LALNSPNLFNYLSEEIYFRPLICLIQFFQIFPTDPYLPQNVVHLSQTAQNKEKHIATLKI